MLDGWSAQQSAQHARARHWPKLLKTALPLAVLFLFIVSNGAAVAERPIVIAHRGASGYLPEHTLAAASLAYGMRADYVEQDVVLTKDSVPVVLHDIHVDSVTNVAQKFPARKRNDGRYYAIDFTLRELQSLRVHERINVASGKPVFPARFPQARAVFQIPTLAEALELVQGLNQTTGRNVGVYPEIKQPAWHREQGYDISTLVLDVLKKYGYDDQNDACFLQCFDQSELMRIRNEFDSELKLIQLVGADNDLLTNTSLEKVATYAEGIGPALTSVLTPEGTATDLTQRAQSRNLVVHPYTFRVDALADGFDDPNELMRVLFDVAKVNGVFSDFPDVCMHFLDDRAQ